jgi:hypothetical protein
LSRGKSFIFFYFPLEFFTESSINCLNKMKTWAVKRPWNHNKKHSLLCLIQIFTLILKQRKKSENSGSSYPKISQKKKHFQTLTCRRKKENIKEKKSFFKTIYILPVRCHCRSSEMCYEVVKVNNKRERIFLYFFRFFFVLSTRTFSLGDNFNIQQQQPKNKTFDNFFFIPFYSVLCFLSFEKSSWKRLIFTARPYHFCRCWKRGLIWQLEKRASFGCESTCCKDAGKFD